MTVAQKLPSHSVNPPIFTHNINTVDELNHLFFRSTIRFVLTTSFVMISITINFINFMKDTLVLGCGDC